MPLDIHINNFSIEFLRIYLEIIYTFFFLRNEKTMQPVQLTQPWDGMVLQLKD